MADKAKEDAKAKAEAAVRAKAKAKVDAKAQAKVRAQSTLDQAEGQATDLQLIIDAVLAAGQTGIEDKDATENYLDTLFASKGKFSPGMNMPGAYRFYSSSHPDPAMQGMEQITADDQGAGTTQTAGLVRLDETVRVNGFKAGNINVLEPIDVLAGIPLMRPNTGKGGAHAVPTPTHQIGTIAFAQVRITKAITVPNYTTKRALSFPAKALRSVMDPQFRITANYYAGGNSTVDDIFSGQYDILKALVDGLPEKLNLTDLRGTTTPSFETAVATVHLTPKRSKRVFESVPAGGLVTAAPTPEEPSEGG